MKTAAELLAVFLGRPEARQACRVVDMYRVWPEVVGGELAEHARPLGHRDGILRLGAEDPVAMQEMTFAVPEILARVNAWLGQNVFDKVQFDLIGTRVSLDAPQAARPVFYAPKPARPDHLGGLVGKLDTSTPVGRCYEKYVRFFQASAVRKRRRGKATNTDLEAERT